MNQNNLAIVSGCELYRVKFEMRAESNLEVSPTDSSSISFLLINWG